ncbi:MAG: SMC-Scp complex subunit ScpB, partial [Wenzhouxiangellaceae bacterium]
MNESPEQSSDPEPELQQIKTWLEAALLAAGEPLSLNQLNGMFDPDEAPGHGVLREALALLDAELEPRAFELVEVASGYRLQIRAPLMPMVSRLWAEKPPRYSRALLETLAIIAYRQPITRGEIEQIRGVSLSGTILKTLQEREWIKVVGHRDIPGKPELLGTTRAFLDYFSLKGLDDLPTLAEIRDLDNIEPELDFNSASA